jgi:hypothetical protein
MPDEQWFEDLLKNMPVESAEPDLVARLQASLANARRRTRFSALAGRVGLAAGSLVVAAALIPRLQSLLALLPSDWVTSTADWWRGLETAPVESFKSLGLQLWSWPSTLAQSADIELILGGLVALFLSWWLFKTLLTGQTSRKVVLQ